MTRRRCRNRPWRNGKDRELEAVRTAGAAVCRIPDRQRRPAAGYWGLIIKGLRFERRLYQGRQCGNGIGDVAARPPDLAAPEPGDGSRIEGTRASAERGSGGLRGGAEDRRRQ